MYDTKTGKFGYFGGLMDVDKMAKFNSTAITQRLYNTIKCIYVINL